jgi:hypothetical protein
MKAIYAQIDDAIREYEHGTVTISDDIEFSMRQTVKRITHYVLSKYMGGQYDVLLDGTKRRKPFRNIGDAIVDLEWRAKNIDREEHRGPRDGWRPCVFPDRQQGTPAMDEGQ